MFAARTCIGASTHCLGLHSYSCSIVSSRSYSRGRVERVPTRTAPIGSYSYLFCEYYFVWCGVVFCGAVSWGVVCCDLVSLVWYAVLALFVTWYSVM